jgi:uncharacterized protein
MKPLHLLASLCGAALLAAPLAADALRPPAEPTRQAQAPAKPRPAPGKVLELDWEELVPVSDRANWMPVPPPPVHDYLSGDGNLASMQPMDFKVNKELDGLSVKLPGFIVPLDVGRDGKVSEFFLVPYFGACIHVPPPPPNQIVFVRVKDGISLDSIYEAYWITGRMSIQNKTTRLGAAAYAIEADKVEIYTY